MGAAACFITPDLYLSCTWSWSIRSPSRYSRTSLCPLFPRRKNQQLSRISSERVVLAMTLCAPHCPLSATPDLQQETLKSSAQSQSRRRTVLLGAPTSSSLMSTLLSADTPPLSASVWFPSCCSNLFMLNLDLQLLARGAFAFSCDFCCQSFKTPASE